MKTQAAPFEGLDRLVGAWEPDERRVHVVIRLITGFDSYTDGHAQLSSATPAGLGLARPPHVTDIDGMDVTLGPPSTAMAEFLSPGYPMSRMGMESSPRRDLVVSVKMDERDEERAECAALDVLRRVHETSTLRAVIAYRGNERARAHQINRRGASPHIHRDQSQSSQMLPVRIARCLVAAELLDNVPSMSLLQYSRALELIGSVLDPKTKHPQRVAINMDCLSAARDKADQLGVRKQLTDELSSRDKLVSYLSRSRARVAHPDADRHKGKGVRWEGVDPFDEVGQAPDFEVVYAIIQVVAGVASESVRGIARSDPFGV